MVSAANNNNGSPDTTVAPAILHRVITASAIGNFIEWFDFAIYGFLAVTLSQHFFPPGEPSLALLQTFAVFAVSFALRPLGGVVFGMLGDRIGRKRVLSLTVLLMAGATTLIGLLPTWQSVGMAAPLALALARCIQGFSTGGEYAGACAFVMEHAPRRQRGRYGSFIPVSTFAAFALAAVLGFTMNALLSEASMQQWGWRVPFLIAAPLGLIGLYMRLRLDESPAFKALRQQEGVPHAPLKETIRSHGAVILCLSAFISATALSFYMFTTYFATYMQVVGHASETTALLASLGALIFAALLCPIVGLYADRVGRRRTIMTACFSLIMAVFPAYWLAGSGNFLESLIGAAMIAIGAVICGVVTAVLLSEQFPTRVRYTASALCYNLAYTVFGGTAPLIATWLIDVSGSNLAPAWYLVVIALLALAGGMRLPETAHRVLEEEDVESDTPLAQAGI
ncbi:MFS transporter [Kushneria phosphatilytica]|uniref:MHS family MFS transporter n=1 Tax=Kushneria phosphatilytica TaxID=657387 RepID=A0A1S1NSU6_9GAMM|nr:MFS transporter [Kushneria phosphatilytica]OHV12319.1 MFS transporter [Kushneria phosphatilytica]QEL11526.1 MHS family MFS transporter [Kushneria phosphatilytica]